jgi:hypothetical protein
VALTWDGANGTRTRNPLLCKVAERASLSVVYARPAANSRIHHRQIALLLLHFAATGEDPLQRVAGKCQLSKPASARCGSFHSCVAGRGAGVGQASADGREHWQLRLEMRLNGSEPCYGSSPFCRPSRSRTSARSLLGSSIAMRFAVRSSKATARVGVTLMMPRATKAKSIDGTPSKMMGRLKPVSGI